MFNFLDRNKDIGIIIILLPYIYPEDGLIWV